MSKAEVYLVAGEASGDRHGAALIQALQESRPDCVCTGVGGPAMKAAGQHQLFDLAAHAVVGLTDVLRNYGKFRSFFHRILKDIHTRKPDAVVLIDYPGMNLRLAKRLRNECPWTKIIFYISPQVWAWKPGRATKMEAWLDRLLVIFPFEVDWFAQRAPGLPVECVGHPTLDRWDLEAVEDPPAPPPFRIALMPGSRKREVAAHLPVMLDALRQLKAREPEIEAVILAAGDETLEQIRTGLEAGKIAGVEVVMGYQMTHLSRCHLALVASGTATLECALAALPLIVLYKSHPLTYWVGRRLVQVPYLSMVNILAGEKVVPEFLQSRVDPDVLADAALHLMRQPKARNRMRARLKEVSRSLGQPGASRRAAEAVLKLI